MQANGVLLPLDDSMLIHLPVFESGLRSESFNFRRGRIRAENSGEFDSERVHDLNFSAVASDETRSMSFLLPRPTTSGKRFRSIEKIVMILIKSIFTSVTQFWLCPNNAL
jgi:hypothetical protein